MSVVYKCKECGGDVQPLENGLGKCLYCGALQTLPKEKDDKISNLLNRANDYRLHCDFDRAIFTYEQVLDLKESEPEAHWGLFLSKYGVEYVKDSMTLTYKPTLHRISAVSVFDDADYQATIKYASPFSVTKYNQDASDIEAVMKELLVISANQEPYDVFLSYKEADDTTGQRTNDSYLAHDLYNELTGKGYKVFFAPKSLGVGLYEPKIYSAIISAKVMIVLGTKPEYFDAVWVKNEWSRFAELIDNGEQKVIVPVYKDMKAEQLPNRLAKFQAYDMASISFLPTLLSIISKFKKQKSRVKISRETKTEDVYLERGFIEIGDKHFTQAKTFFENVLNINPHNAQAYFGELMVEMHITKPEQVLTTQKYLSEYTTFKNAVKFADQQLKTTLLQYEKTVKDNVNEQRYELLLKSLSRIETEENLKYAIKGFEELNGYKNSDECAKYLKDQVSVFHYRWEQIKKINKEKENSKNSVSGYYSTDYDGIVIFGGIILGIILGCCTHRIWVAIVASILLASIGGSFGASLPEIVHKMKVKKAESAVENFEQQLEDIQKRISEDLENCMEIGNI